MIISSQRHLDLDIVAAKLIAQDFTVTLSPAFEYDSMELQVVLDGHHSYAAAVEAGVTPIYITANSLMDDSLSGVTNPVLGCDPEEYLERHYIDSDWYAIETGELVW